MRELQATRPITNLITNHTYSNLLLRPPGVVDTRAPLEDVEYEALGARMASHNGYANGPSYGLYDTTGGMEDWTFWTAGSLGFTFEIGPDGFHPPYETAVVAEYLGLEPAAGAGQGGNREAYYEMLRSTVDAGLHSVIAGTGAGGLEAEHLEVVRDRRRRRSGTTTSAPTSAIRSCSTTRSATTSTSGAGLRMGREPVDTAVRGRPARPRRAGEKQADIPFANPAGQPARTRITRPTARSRSSRSTSRVAGGRQRALHGAHRMGQPGDRLGRLRL